MFVDNRSITIRVCVSSKFQGYKGELLYPVVCWSLHLNQLLDATLQNQLFFMRLISEE